LLLSAAAGAVQAETIYISFDDLDSLARTESPGSRIIENEYKKTLAERDAQLQWSNPEVAYDREDVDVSEEYQVTVGKQFAMPWAHLKKRSAWNERANSAEFLRQAQTIDHLADLKSGYVTVQVHDQYLVRLEQLRNILTDASHVASSRHIEGHLSGVEEHLVQMTVISLNASYQNAKQRQREALAQWRASTGLGAEDRVVLSTDIDYREFSVKAAEQYAEMIESQPGLQTRHSLQQALTKQASAARASFIPSFNLYGGYKKIEPGYDGYVAGISLSLPLFNRNGAEARKYEAESNIAAQQVKLYQAQVAGRIESLTSSIAESQSMLAIVSGHFDEDEEALSNLLYSYEEGWITLNELLNAMQIETAGLEDYYSQLIRYYEDLFELEALTGETLVTF
jgi:outer membrane protein TolC